MAGYFTPSYFADSYFPYQSGLSEGNAEAFPAGVDMAASVGSADVTGGSVAEPLGVETVAEVGYPTATGTAAVIDPPIATIGGGGGGRKRRIVRTVQVDAVARPAGVSMLAEVGQAVASGSAEATPFGVGARVQAGIITARGTRNLTWQQIVILAEAA